ncbi:carbamoyltransferase family protein [Rubinisphaera italica]|uniref:Decarbamoylnovobiocin carbamoyltransferase n=1 Tax=Rubinisphaera italica TaxID=2527969 RepID=A0A5C5XMJ8_9PLAN|nr:carbamoyltransferase [Rubinisphaera italica]TWT63593.1 Decarbamoylnovobiocin carbamoyltransferase [Rubinisphaera italica]
MTAILGISGFFHDSAAVVVVDGEIVAAAQEERFSRIKHDHHFPRQALAYCLEEAGLTTTQLDYVGFYEKPLLKFDRLLQTYVSYSPAGFRSFAKSMPQWLKQKLHLPRIIRRELKGSYRKQIIFTGHHQSHAASAFFPSPFDEAAVLTVDGVGEWSTATYGVGRGNRIDLTHELHFPHSLGLLYSAFTYYCGFNVDSDEYKLMGLAPYGEPVYADLIRKHLIDLKPDGSFRLDMKYFQYCQGLTMTSRHFDRLFGHTRRQPESEWKQHYMDMAASIQLVTEEILLNMVQHLHKMTGMKNLCLAGGVALNCVSNGRILREGPFEKIWIQPAAGDAGGALGTALFLWYQLMNESRKPVLPDAMKGCLLGPAYSTANAAEKLQSLGANFKEISESELLNKAAALLADGKIVGWMQGRMEYGPRALGCRSILGDPRRAEMQSRINQSIKFRESFRPFAPAVLEEFAGDYFKLKSRQSSSYMQFVAEVQPWLLDDPTKTDHTNQSSFQLPAVTHVDHSARLQKVDTDHNPRFAKLLSAFHQLTGCPVLINTSFNVRGEPIVCTPEEAFQCFMSTDMDVLVIEDIILIKDEQP